MQIADQECASEFVRVCKRVCEPMGRFVSVCMCAWVCMRSMCVLVSIYTSVCECRAYLMSKYVPVDVGQLLHVCKSLCPYVMCACICVRLCVLTKLFMHGYGYVHNIMSEFSCILTRQCASVCVCLCVCGCQLK